MAVLTVVEHAILNSLWFRLHLAQSLHPRFRQAVALSGMRRFALHPVRLEQAFFRQPSKIG